jgi:hypothetical protein
MDMYRVTIDDPLPRCGPKVRYGTKRRALAVVRSVKQDNESRRDGAAWYSRKLGGEPIVPKLASVTIERAQVGEFTDVTAEFTGDGSE